MNDATSTIEGLRLQLETSRNWYAMSQRITTALLEDTDEEDALTLIASSVMEVAEAATVLIVLPSLGGRYICEIAQGISASEMIGVEFPPEGRAQAVIRSNEGMIVPSMERVQSLRIPLLSQFGPALYAPLSERGNANGVIILFRSPGSPEFTHADLQAAEDLAGQATLALRLSGIRLAEEHANILEQRGRIARDLHDLAIQQLFATSLQLSSLKEDLVQRQLFDDFVAAGIDQALSSVADSIEQIRSIVSDLREEDHREKNLLNGLWQECSMARRTLGFAPSLLVRVNDQVATNEGVADLNQLVQKSLGEAEVADALAVVREGLTNVARHAHATQVTVEASLWTTLAQIPECCRENLQNTVPLRLENTGLFKITITDDGTGIGKTVRRHSGLANMAARASAHFGQMQINERVDTSGTRLVWCIPVSF